MSKLIQQVSAYLCMDVDIVEEQAKCAPRTYKRYMIPKKSGGQREIHHPSKQTKAIQYAITDIVLCKLEVHECAAAYIPGTKSPLRKLAQKHTPYSYTIHMDMKDFFPSIRPEDLFEFGNRDSENCKYFQDSDHQFLKDCLFAYRSRRGYFLSIGAPTSPIISNIVMLDIDKKCEKFAHSQDACFSRYADDLIYSTNTQGECKGFEEFVKETIASSKCPQLEINTQKTRYFSRKGHRAVTGLVLTSDKNISIGRKKKRYVRKLIFDLKNGRLEEDKQEYLGGYLAYVLDVEPQFYNNLVHKYGSELVQKALYYKAPEVRHGE